MVCFRGSLDAVTSTDHAGDGGLAQKSSQKMCRDRTSPPWALIVQKKKNGIEVRPTSTFLRQSCPHVASLRENKIVAGRSKSVWPETSSFCPRNEFILKSKPLEQATIPFTLRTHDPPDVTDTRYSSTLTPGTED